MAKFSTQLLLLLGLYWMIIGQSRYCNASFQEPDWQCDNGEHVQKRYVCDMGQDCSDGSDESPATCCPSTCPSDSDICIPAGVELFHGQDCRYCQYGWLAGWRCNSGQCIKKVDVCNGGRQDCSDGSDESLATCCPSTCPSDPDICIPAGVDILPEQDIPWWSLTHVEKEKDCRDCTARGSYADPGWRCNSGQCIKKEDVCNGGRGDCSDGSDESPATCCPSSCPSDPDICFQAGDKLLPGQDCRDCDASSVPNWRCNSGQCVLRSFVCDGRVPHCPDGSDESPATCCPSTCPSDPDICIQAGDILLPGQNCRDCTDEWGAHGWRCNSGRCLMKWTLCDGRRQCSDGSDESPATCCASTCPSDPDICIPVGEKLLLGKDCRHCKHAGYPGWRCNSGQCLLKEDVCDGIPQCSDGSDETFGCLVDDVWWTTGNPPTYWEKLINTLG